MVDLWPNDIAAPKKKAPVTILKDQASLLGNKTQGLVLADIKKSDADSFYVGKKLYKKQFVYKFYIVSPALENYRYNLFSMANGIDLYPVLFSVDEDIGQELGLEEDKPLTANSESEFIETIKKLFASKKTIKVVHSILSQLE
jgi:hypothetical protein